MTTRYPGESVSTAPARLSWGTPILEATCPFAIAVTRSVPAGASENVTTPFASVTASCGAQSGFADATSTTASGKGAPDAVTTRTARRVSGRCTTATSWRIPGGSGRRSSVGLKPRRCYREYPGSGPDAFKQRFAGDRRRRFGAAAAFDSPRDERPRHRLARGGVDDANRQKTVGDRHGHLASADRHVDPPHVQRVGEVHGDVRRTWRETRERDTSLGVGCAAAVRRNQRECDERRRAPTDQQHWGCGCRVVRSRRDHDPSHGAGRRQDSERGFACNDDACVTMPVPDTGTVRASESG